MRMDQLVNLIDVVPDENGTCKIVLHSNGASIEFPAKSLIAAMPDQKALDLLTVWMANATRASLPANHIKPIAGIPVRLQNEFAHYINSLFKSKGIEISQVQLSETRMAFFAGCLVSIGHLAMATRSSKEEGAKMISELLEEASFVGQEISRQTQNRN